MTFDASLSLVVFGASVIRTTFSHFYSPVKMINKPKSVTKEPNQKIIAIYI